jgi:hypothetical protein
MLSSIVRREYTTPGNPGVKYARSGWGRRIKDEGSDVPAAIGTECPIEAAICGTEDSAIRRQVKDVRVSRIDYDDIDILIYKLNGIARIA